VCVHAHAHAYSFIPLVNHCVYFLHAYITINCKRFRFPPSYTTGINK